jgi:hypothetical protein
MRDRSCLTRQCSVNGCIRSGLFSVNTRRQGGTDLPSPKSCKFQRLASAAIPGYLTGERGGGCTAGDGAGAAALGGGPPGG